MARVFLTQVSKVALVIWSWSSLRAACQIWSAVIACIAVVGLANSWPGVNVQVAGEMVKKLRGFNGLYRNRGICAFLALSSRLLLQSPEALVKTLEPNGYYRS